ncbi:piggyBac transposable element-derived protein 2-like [Stegodyphus dumicola]|uniref:piggyBac transposable element-derived protein 2-like n=1 Tax=Stegodyphus dumicola TaxID=202533 RepID=UPI0015A9DD2C|nr:piggyBac transposable element-derived protein 2-like [Stegodyphus dumicola]
MVNHHALYCISNDKIPWLEFRRMVARGYLALSSELSDAKKGGRTSFTKASITRVPTVIRTSGNHYIERTENGKQRKCSVCKTNARKQCGKCNIGLHEDCFERWH